MEEFNGQIDVCCSQSHRTYWKMEFCRANSSELPTLFRLRLREWQECWNTHFCWLYQSLRHPPPTMPADFAQMGSSAKAKCTWSYAAARWSSWITINRSQHFSGRPNVGQLLHQQSLSWLIKGRDGGGGGCSASGTSGKSRVILHENGFFLLFYAISNID